VTVPAELQCDSVRRWVRCVTRARWLKYML